MAEAPGNPELDASIAETQKLLGALIKKPPLAAKHLAKPPFRFLHDIVSEVIRTTGFGQGLYTDDEMNADNIKEKDPKLTYLTKLTTCISFASKTVVEAKPAKIIAGLEPEKTNLMLQLLAKAIQGKVDSKDAVKRTLAGEQFTAGKPAAAAKAAPPSKEKSVSKEKLAEKPKEQPAAGAPKAEPPKRDAAPSAAATAAPAKAPAEKKPEEKQKEKPKEEPIKKAEEKPKDAAPAAPQPQKAPAAAPAPAEKKAEPPKDQAPKEEKKAVTAAAPAPAKEKAAPKKSDMDAVDEPALGSTGDVAADEDGNAASGFVQRRPGRPTSARPAPPRPKKAEVQPDLSRAEAPVVISDSAAQDDKDDELVFVDPHELSKTVEVDDGKHGGLVSKIMKTKQDFEGDEKKQGAVIADILPKKDEKAATQKEIENLRQNIQALTRAANPLGKTMDYVQEDLDSMSKELEFWKKESQKYNRQLEEEQRTTDESLLPLENQLRQIESGILDQLERISASKANILQHELTIQKLLSNITNASR